MTDFEPVYRVAVMGRFEVGPYTTRAEAEAVAAKLSTTGRTYHVFAVVPKSPNRNSTQFRG